MDLSFIFWNIQLDKSQLQYVYFSGWWFGTFGLFFHRLGIIIPTDFPIFQMGGSTTNHIYIYIYYNATSLRHQETLRVSSHRAQLQESLLQILVQPLELVNQVPRSPGVHRVKKRTMFGSSLGSSHLMIICLVVWNHGISW